MGPRTMTIGPAQRVAALARETTSAQLRRPEMRSSLAALAA